MESTVQRPGLCYTQEQVRPNLLRTHVPTLPFEAFSPWGGSVLPWHILRLFDATPTVSGRWPSTDSTRYVVFEVYLKTEIDRSFYNIESPKHPLVMDKEIQYIKRASKCHRITLYHADCSTPYVTMTDVDVNIDPETRKPKPYPDTFKTHFGVPSEPPYKVIKTVVSKPRLNVVKTSHRVRFSDTDENKHANYAIYLKFAYNSFCENMINNKYNKDVKHLFNGGVKMFEMTFKQESLLGDMLCVESWEDDDHSDMYHFELKKGSDVSCFVTMQFYTNTAEGSKM